MKTKNDSIEFTDILRVQGVKANGYGFIGKLVMQDRRLTRDAKAIYSYFCSYAGAGTTAFPSVSKICYDLDFKKEETFRKHLKLLKQYDYIKVFQEKGQRGQFGKNIYMLIDNPNPEIIDISQDSPSPEKRVYGKKVSTVEKGVREKGGTKSNSILKVTILKNNQLISQQPKENITAHGDDELTNILKKANIDLYNDNLKDLLKDTIIQLYESNKQVVNKIDVYAIDEAISRYRREQETKDIKNPKLYFKKCLKSAIEESGLALA